MSKIVSRNTPEPSLSPPEEEISAVCSVCGGEIYTYELYGVGVSGAVCTECARDRWRSLTEAEMLRFLGFMPEWGVPGRRKRFRGEMR